MMCIRDVFTVLHTFCIKFVDHHNYTCTYVRICVKNIYFVRYADSVENVFLYYFTIARYFNIISITPFHSTHLFLSGSKYNCYRTINN